MAKTDGVARIIALAALGKDGGGSTGGTTNYLELANKPKINDVELTGNKTLEDLGINIPDLENYYTKDVINEELNKKQNTLIAGDNITLDGNTISAKGTQPTFYIYIDKSTQQINGKSYTYSSDSQIAQDFREFLSTVDNMNFKIVVKFNTQFVNDGSYIECYPSTLLDKSPSEYASNHSSVSFISAVQYENYTVNNGGLGFKVYVNIGIYNGEYTSIGIYTVPLPYLPITTTNNSNVVNFVPTQNYHPATKKYVDDNIKIYTAGENITISEDNVISANVSGGTDSNAVYTYYAPYSDEDWFTEENVASILQTVKDKGYSNFELCTLNGSHYALRKGENLQTLTTTEEYYDLEYLQNDLKNYVYYTFVARLDENGKIVAEHLSKNVLTAEEVLHNLLPLTLKDFPGYDSSASHLMLQSNEGNIEWDSSLDGGVFGDSYADPTYYTEKQVDKIVTDTVNEVLGGKY